MSTRTLVCVLGSRGASNVAHALNEAAQIEVRLETLGTTQRSPPPVLSPPTALPHRAIYRTSTFPPRLRPPSSFPPALPQAVTIKKSMAAWPDGLASLRHESTPLRELLILDKLSVSLDQLGPGGYGPLALLVRRYGGGGEQGKGGGGVGYALPTLRVRRRCTAGKRGGGHARTLSHRPLLDSALPTLFPTATPPLAGARLFTVVPAGSAV
jgi:hypothetical protein